MNFFKNNYKERDLDVLVVVAINLVRLMKIKHFSFDRLMEEARISKNTLSYIRKGKYNVSVATLDKLAKALGVKVCEFFKEI